MMGLGQQGQNNEGVGPDVQPIAGDPACTCSGLPCHNIHVRPRTLYQHCWRTWETDRKEQFIHVGTMYHNPYATTTIKVGRGAQPTQYYRWGSHGCDVGAPIQFISHENPNSSKAFHGLPLTDLQLTTDMVNRKHNR